MTRSPSSRSFPSSGGGVGEGTTSRLRSGRQGNEARLVDRLGQFVDRELYEVGAVAATQRDDATYAAFLLGVSEAWIFLNATSMGRDFGLRQS